MKKIIIISTVLIYSSLSANFLLSKKIDKDIINSMSMSSGYVVGSVYPDCKGHLEAGAYNNGTYKIDPDGEGGLTPFDAYCDMKTDGGGWTLVLNYLNKSGENPSLNTRNSNLPLYNGEILGESQSGTIYWGHASNQLINKFNFSETQWYCKAGNHSRIVHFKSPVFNDYFKTGYGSPYNQYRTNSTNLNKYSGASLPLNMSSTEGYGNQGIEAMTNFPIFGNSAINGNRAHWAVKGQGRRWECDNQTGVVTNTFHQIYIR